MSNPPGTSEQVTDDSALIERSQRGDLSAFDRLVLIHQEVVFAVALRMLGDADEAQDVAQDAFVRAFRGIHAFRREAKFSTWLIAITMNLCRNRRRWWARRRGVIVASLDDPVETGEGTVGQEMADPAPGPGETASRAEFQQYLLRALQMLEEPFRKVIVLRDIHGYSYEEIAQMLHCQVGTVKSRINRARLQLRALLDGRV